MEFENEVLAWPLRAYGNIVRGDETTSEDQVGTAITPDVARRLVACWNACAGISTTDLELGNYEIHGSAARIKGNGEKITITTESDPEALLGLFPGHKCSLTLRHNDHKDIYESAVDWIASNDWCEWEDEDAKKRAIATDSIWTLQWYPHTPIGFNAIAAPTLGELLAWANEPGP